MTTLQIVVAVLLVAAVAAFLLTHRRGSGGTASAGRPDRSGRQTSAAREALSAQRLLLLVKSLEKSNAQWPTILAQINPEGDRRIAALLHEIRGPHMFAPHLALSVLAEGARSVHADASVLEALTAARNSMNKVVRFGD